MPLNRSGAQPPEVRLDLSAGGLRQPLLVCGHFDDLTIEKKGSEPVGSDSTGLSTVQPLIQLLLVADQIGKVAASPTGNVSLEGTGVRNPSAAERTVTTYAALFKNQTLTGDYIWQICRRRGQGIVGKQIGDDVGDLGV